MKKKEKFPENFKVKSHVGIIEDGNRFLLLLRTSQEKYWEVWSNKAKYLNEINKHLSTLPFKFNGKSRKITFEELNKRQLAKLERQEKINRLINKFNEEENIKVISRPESQSLFEYHFRSVLIDKGVLSARGYKKGKVVNECYQWIINELEKGKSAIWDFQKKEKLFLDGYGEKEKQEWYKKQLENLKIEVDYDLYNDYLNSVDFRHSPPPPEEQVFPDVPVTFPQKIDPIKAPLMNEVSELELLDFKEGGLNIGRLFSKPFISNLIEVINFYKLKKYVFSKLIYRKDQDTFIDEIEKTILMSFAAYLDYFEIKFKRKSKKEKKFFINEEIEKVEEKGVRFRIKFANPEKEYQEFKISIKLDYQALSQQNADQIACEEIQKDKIQQGLLFEQYIYLTKKLSEIEKTSSGNDQRKQEKKKKPQTLLEVWEPDSKGKKDQYFKMIEFLKKENNGLGKPFVNEINGKLTWNRSLKGPYQYLAGFIYTITEEKKWIGEWFTHGEYKTILSNTFNLNGKFEPFKYLQGNIPDEKYLKPFQNLASNLK